MTLRDPPVVVSLVAACNKTAHASPPPMHGPDHFASSLPITFDAPGICKAGAGGGGAGGGNVGPAAICVAPPHNGGIATGIGAGAARPYSLRPICFRRDQFKSAADCLTAAYTRGPPLEVCQ